jgi:hypothetical protein
MMGLVSCVYKETVLEGVCSAKRGTAGVFVGWKDLVVFLDLLLPKKKHNTLLTYY